MSNKRLVRVTFGGSNRKYNQHLSAIGCATTFHTAPLRTRIGGKRFDCLVYDSPALRRAVAATPGITIKPYEDD